MSVTVQYFKYPDLLHWRHDAHRLGEDEFGVWLAIVAAATIQRGHEPARPSGRDSVQLITRGQWWSLLFNGPGDVYELYVDIATPAFWESPDRVTMVDLDLDVVRYQDGTVAILDEDEFAKHQVAHAYPQKLIDQTRAATAAVVLAVEENEEPFASVAAAWLARLKE